MLYNIKNGAFSISAIENNEYRLIENVYGGVRSKIEKPAISLGWETRHLLV